MNYICIYEYVIRKLLDAGPFGSLRGSKAAADVKSPNSCWPLVEMLSRKYGVNLDSHLSKEQKATAHSFRSVAHAHCKEASQIKFNFGYFK